MTQERMNSGDEQRATPISDYQAPDIESTISRAQSKLNQIRIVNGANEGYYDNLGGKTVGSVRKSLRDVFNIAGDSTALVGSKEVGDDFILEGGMSLEFSKDSGVKGMSSERFPLITMRGFLLIIVLYLLSAVPVVALASNGWLPKFVVILYVPLIWIGVQIWQYCVTSLALCL